ncbi:MAG TPA: NADH-quinone oxidoreductase subunit N [Thermodesulfovibrionales bacterium]|nr:NADH-quinone oxidoreductase subunit N [Thermodesulfovibrionales bacterium]
MSVPDLLVLTPLAAMALTALAVMLVIALHRNHWVVAALTLGGLGLSFASLFLVSSLSPRRATPLLIIDDYALFYTGLIIAASIAVTLFSFGYLERREGDHEEFYLLLVLATLGAAVLVASSHFASLFLGLELLSISLYSLFSYLRDDERSMEAGVKYLVLASVSAAFLLFGMALIYAECGSLEFRRIASEAGVLGSKDLLFLTGSAMVLTGIGFKLAVVPFHLWTPDVYEGAPAPVTAFVATISKGAVFALLLRYSRYVHIHASSAFFLIFALIAASSMFVGNLLALQQNNLKRILAYSSIAHLGYLLVAFLSGGPFAAEAVAYYLVSYFVTTLGAFGVVTVLSGKKRDADTLDDYRGLASDHPLIAGVFTAMLLSLAGIPLTAGFIAKFFIVTAGVNAALWGLVITLVINSGIALFYYLRVMIVMYSGAREKRTGRIRTGRLSLTGGIVLVVLTLALIGLGIYPSPLMRLLQATVTGLM